MAQIIDAILKLTDNFSQPLLSAANNLSQYSRQVTRCGKDLQTMGKNISNVGATLTKTVTAPIAAIGAASLKTTMDFDSSMSKVQALSGATGDELASLRDEALRLGAATAWSASDVSDAMQYMALAGWDAEKMLEGTEGIMNAASATGEDLARVCDIITDGLSAFGMSANESTHFADVLAKTASSSNTTIEMMGEAFTYTGSVAGAFKYSIEDTALAIGLMANSGIKGSQAGTALRKAMTELTGTFKISGEKLGEYVVETTDAQGNMLSFRETLLSCREAFKYLDDAEKAVEAEALVGKTGMAGFLAMMNASDADFEKLAGNIDNATGSAKEMSNVMLNNLKGQITIIKSGIESLAIAIGDRLTPYARALAERIQAIVDKFNGLSDAQKDQIVKWGAIIAVVPILITGFGKIISIVGTITIAVGKMLAFFKGITGIKALFAAILTPANVVVLAIVGIATAAFLIIKNWDKVKVWLVNFAAVVKTKMSECGFDFTAFKVAVDTCKAAIGNAFNTIKQWLADHQAEVNAVINFIKTLISIWVDNVVTLFSVCLANIGTIIQGILKVISGIAEFLTGVFTLDLDTALNGISTIISGVVDTWIAFFTAPFKALWEVATNTINKVKEALGLSSELGSSTGILGSASVSNAATSAIQGHATGVKMSTGGIRKVNEKGGELINLPNGSRVIPHDESLRAAYNEGASNSTGNITIAKLADQIVVREEADIDRIADRLVNKLTSAAFNM